MSDDAEVIENMYLGELVEYGDTAQMFAAATDERTKAYLTGKMG